ncbi:hypothetical protein EYF80_000141 [Liparis tanakae]|uniref:Uncharacterized protein n=1 Tax=Liparis tanakae TaxID=230148 RepID=A0A4Z2JIT7_9TELE|nr:hypothetical protein EYF80_000141 [Liparis tanakae]
MADASDPSPGSQRRHKENRTERGGFCFGTPVSSPTLSLPFPLWGSACNKAFIPIYHITHGTPQARIQTFWFSPENGTVHSDSGDTLLMVLLWFLLLKASCRHPPHLPARWCDPSRGQEVMKLIQLTGLLLQGLLPPYG